MADHRADFPPEYPRWIDGGYELRTADLIRSEEVRSEICDAAQGVPGPPASSSHPSAAAQLSQAPAIQR